MKKYIKAGWLIDGSGGPIKKNVVLEIANGIIGEIKPYDASDPPDSITTTDYSRSCLLPPMIDCHTHLCMSGTLEARDREMQLEVDYDGLKPLIAEHVGDQFSHGVLALRDGGDRHGAVLRYLQEEFAAQKLPLRIMSPGSAYHREGRYGKLIGRAVKSTESLLDAIVSSGHESDYLKIVNSGVNSLAEYGRQTAPQFAPQELEQVVAWAREKNKRVMVHANGELPVRQAIEAGCHSVEHGFFMGDENLRLMAERGTFWVPTVYTMKACLESAELGMKDATPSVVARTLSHQLQQLKRARSLGVKVAVGTDAGSIGVLHGEAMINELKLFLQAGYPLVEAIRCGSTVGAELLGIDDDFGLIAPGKKAHFLLCRGAPAQLPRKLRLLEAIYFDGEPNEAYRDMLRKARIHRE